MKSIVSRILMIVALFSAIVLSASIAVDHGKVAGIAAGAFAAFAVASAAVHLARPTHQLGATYTNLDDEIFSNSALEGFINTLVPFNAFSRNFSADAVDRGDTVLVPLIGSLTATTFSAYNICGGSQSVITISIDKHKHVPIGQNDLTAAASSRANLESFGYQAGAALGLLVFQDVMSLITTGNFSLATAVSVVDFGIAQIRAARLMLGNSKVPMSGRAAILDINPFDNLLGISNFLQVNLSGSNESLREGRIGRAMGLDIFETQALPGTNSVMGFFGHPQAIAVAMRYLRPQDGHTYLRAQPLTDAATGMTIGLRDHYDNNTGTRYVNLEANYGYSKGISDGLRVLKRLD